MNRSREKEEWPQMLGVDKNGELNNKYIREAKSIEVPSTLLRRKCGPRFSELAASLSGQ